MLSYDSTEAAANAFDRQVAEAQARGSARALAQTMMRFERNVDPHPERSLENPANGVRIRRWVPAVEVRVDEQCKAHNTLVANLGVAPK
jgi:hypothetical protein